MHNYRAGVLRAKRHITNEIAKRMGHGERIPVQSVEELVEKDLQVAGLSLAQLKAEDGIHLQDGKDPYSMPAEFVITSYSIHYTKLYDV